MKKLIALTGVLFAVSMILQRCDYPGAPSTSPTSASTNTQVPGSPYVGNMAPAFSVKGVDNETVDLSKLRGKVVLLAFFGTTA